MMRKQFQGIEIRVLMISSKENKAEKRETFEFILTSAILIQCTFYKGLTKKSQKENVW